MPASSPAPRASPVARAVAAPFIATIWLYRVTLAPLMGGHCRFTPSCSAYALEAFRSLPPHRAAWLTLRRLLRCHPWGGRGFDPVPGELPSDSGEVREKSGS